MYCKCKAKCTLYWFWVLPFGKKLFRQGAFLEHALITWKFILLSIRGSNFDLPTNIYKKEKEKEKGPLLVKITIMFIGC